MYPDWSAPLRGYYWQLRHVRKWNAAAVRRHYRRIFAEKQRLREKKIDPEEIRLLCRHLANPAKIHAETAWKAYTAQLRFDFQQPCQT
jgi:hypothetical protein